MSLRFSFLVLIDSNGTPSAKVYKKENAQEGLNEYSKARDQGKEAYWFQTPRADKRCKSDSARDQLDNAISGMSKTKPEAEPEAEPVKPSKKAKMANGLTDLD
jgi:hypothetical protein